MWNYGVGFWVDELINKDYDELPKDQQAFFDMMHAMVDNYTWLIHALRRSRKLSQGMRIGIIALYLSHQHLRSSASLCLPGVDKTTKEAQVLSRTQMRSYNTLLGLGLGSVETI
jgi:hypothetical protein